MIEDVRNSTLSCWINTFSGPRRAAFPLWSVELFAMHRIRILPARVYRVLIIYKPSAMRDFLQVIDSMIYPWSLAYVNAVLESDPTKIKERICEAEDAMLRRAHSMKLDVQELQAMDKAARALQKLQEDRAQSLR
jgi:hypothetical protein